MENMSLIFALLVLALLNMCVFSLLMSLVYRYSTIIPGKLKLILESTGSSVFLIILHVICLALTTYCVFSFKTGEEAKKLAIEYNSDLAEFIDEPSFIFLNPEKARIPITIILCVAIMIILITALCIILLILQVRKLPAHEEIQKAIVRSLTFQVIITIVFLLTPDLIFLTVMIFQIPNTFTLVSVVQSIATFHAFVEMMSILYFVLPYRHYIRKEIKKIKMKMNIVSSIDITI